MPRAKIDYQQKHLLEMVSIANLKSYSTDLLYDFSVIYPMRLEKCAHWLSDEDLHELQKKTTSLSKFHVKPTITTRVYIVTGDTTVRFAMYNMDESVVENLEYVYDLVGDHFPQDCSPAYLSTLYIFRKGKFSFSSDLSAGQLAELMAVFHKENLVNYAGARDDLYGKPRREARHPE